jgi:hypothetical protein
VQFLLKHFVIKWQTADMTMGFAGEVQDILRKAREEMLRAEGGAA